MTDTATVELPTASEVRSSLGVPSQRGRISTDLARQWVLANPSDSKKLARKLGLPAKSSKLSTPTVEKLVRAIAKPAAGRPKNPDAVPYVPSPVRAWAIANGFPVKQGKGRLALAVHEAYAAAMKIDASED